MQTKMTVSKKKISSAVLVALFALIISTAMIFLCLPYSLAASASSGSSGSMVNYDIAADSKIVLDINGKTADLNTFESNIKTNNDSHSFRERAIALNALHNETGYGLAKEENIYNYTNDYFSIEAGNYNNASGEYLYNSISIKAKKTTDTLGRNPRFALVLKNGNATKKIQVEVEISAYLPTDYRVSSVTDAVVDVYVGALLQDDQTSAALDSLFPLEISNYSEYEIDLEKVVLKRKLYTENPKNAMHNITAETDKNTVRAGNEYLAFNGFGEYGVDRLTAPTVSGKACDVSYYSGDYEDKLSFVWSVNFNQADVQELAQSSSKEGYVWKDDGAYFDFTVKIISGSSYLNIHIPVVFTPSERPRAKAVEDYKFNTSLNVSSTAEPDIDHNKQNVYGYKTVRIRPSDIADFPTYNGEGIRFTNLENQFVTGTNSYISAVRGGEGDDIYYDVTAEKNGSANLTFTINYYRHGESYSRSDFTVTVPFTAYGEYDVRLDIGGTRNLQFSINSAAFKALKDDTYQLMSAKGWVKDESVEFEDYATVSYFNGTINIRPKQSVGYDKIGIKTTLVNMDGHRIEIICNVRIDIDATNFFAGWLLWEIILFWVGIGLAALLLILFIIWLFVRSIHKRKIDELETSAPTSAYIIKLNSTIAAAQAQQQLATQQANSQGQMLQLGAGGNPAQVNPNTLALGATPQNSAGANMQNTLGAAPQMSMGNTVSMGATQQMSGNTYSMGATYAPTTESMTFAPTTDEIIIPISDEELLIRIYEEKFEPRGMLKRTFDKSKDLQQRELQKEKERIREDVRNGMSIEEACKSLKQREAESAGMAAATQQRDIEPAVQIDPLIVLLGFDPADPIIADVTREEPQEEWSDEEKKLKEAEYNNLRLRAELAIIASRAEAITAANEKTEADAAGANIALEELQFGIKEAEQKLDDKNTDLAVERRKSAKEALNKEIAELEAKIRADKDAISGRKAEIETANGLLARIKELLGEYSGKKEATEALVSASDGELEAARAEAQKAAELAEKARKQAALAAQLEVLNPMMFTVNTLDGEIRELAEAIEGSDDDKDSRKTAVATLQNELLSTTDSAKINEISARIKDLNKEISELDRAATANTTLKTNKGIEMAAVRRKANEFIDKESIELDDVITAEDLIIGNIALDKLLKQVEADKAAAEEAVAHWHGVCDSMTENLDASVTEAASGVAERVKQAEDALTEAQDKLNEVNLKIELSEDDDEKLNLSMEQVTLGEEVDALTKALEDVRAEGIKANLEQRTQGEAELEAARGELERAQEDFERASARYHEVKTGVNPLDLITSGSGIISQDRKKIEAENLKKILEEQKNAIEQAKLQAQIAQQEAEKAVADAQRASEESRAEAERLAQEALERAEAAREEAELARKEAAEEAERARQEAAEEAERIRREAEEKTEEARRMAEEEAERACEEAELARKEAAEEAERARQEAAEEAERIRKEAEEKTEEARRMAEEEAERARKEAEEEAERARKAAEEEAEQARKAAEEEAEKARKEAEEEAEKARLAAEEEAKNKARIEEKIAKRKAEIATLREELKNVTEEDQGNALREKFYSIQLSLDEEEKTSTELTDLLAKSMDDASHAAELSRYKKLANQKPRRIVKKVTERVNRIPKARPGARPARPGARPARPGARPAARSGARPARPGARPARPGARPGARPTRPGARPTGRGPTSKK
ncbi:hypothetical protein [Pumilibacter intestinalis]|uniref:hypothetical protein n=1 Tax=Pumilibacter intestinalis TaxID=2941511 RepID=UPI00203E9C3B|nr:hypothetical protein [Pumilibacter intestinalis]